MGRFRSQTGPPNRIVFSADSAMPTPDSDSPPSPPPPRKPRREEGFGSGAVWLIMAGLLCLLLFTTWFGAKTDTNEVTYSQFVASIESGDLKPEAVQKLTIGAGLLTYQTSSITGDKVTAISHSVPTSGLGSETIARLTALLHDKGFTFTGDRPPSFWQTLIAWLAVPIIFAFVLLFMVRKMSGASSALSFGRSRGRMHASEERDVTFDQVAGCDEAVEELREVVDFLKNPQKYQALGGRIPRGVLLVGPPGTGKTMLARAVAGEAGVPFFSLSGSDFVEMFVGVGAARVRDMFAQATARSPSIIFIDELDALGKTRGSGMPGGHDEREQTLNALLVEMDGFASDQSVIVMAATNRPETLDPALMRPGRFDRHVLVAEPDIKGREAILKVHIKNVKVDDEVDLQRIARLTPGFVGADLANLINEAALLAARSNKNRVTMQEFEEGIERVVAGLEKQSKLIQPQEKQRVAYHECGHALVACSLPHTDPVQKVSIIPRGLSALGYMRQSPNEERYLTTQSELQNRICVLLGGITAEQHVFGEISTGASNDLERASDIARRMVMEFGMSPRLGRVNYRESGRSPFTATMYMPRNDFMHSEETLREIDLEVKRIIDDAAEIVSEILTRRRGVLEHLAKELVEREVMDGGSIQKILDEHTTSPRLAAGTSVPVVPPPLPAPQDQPDTNDASPPRHADPA